MRVLVCGGRDYADTSTLWGAMDTLRRKHDHLIVFQGGAHGADQIAREWCMKRQVSFVTVEAEWEVHGKAAGPIRNQKMLDLYKPEIVLAFPGGRGTADMVRRAEAAGIKVVKPCEHVDSSEEARKAMTESNPCPTCGYQIDRVERINTENAKLRAVLTEAEALLRVAHYAHQKLGLEGCGNKALPHETRMFATHFSQPETPKAPEHTILSGDGRYWNWRAAAKEARKSDLLPVPKGRTGT